jgi:solute carrier family 25, member 38
MERERPTRLPLQFLCALSAGLLSTTITHPPDVIKTRMQLTPEKYTNLFTSTYWIFKEDGLRGFYRGLAPRCLRKTISAAIIWTLYEEIVRRIQQSRP